MQHPYFKLTVTYSLIIMMLLSTLSIFTQTVRAATPIKVATIGDSITWGAGTSNQTLYSYPAQLQALLGANYSVGNYGHSGATMLKQGDTPYWNTTEYTASKDFLPNIVVIMLGTNDSKSWNWQYKSAYISNYEEMIAVYRALSSHPTVYINMSPPAFSAAYGIDGAVIQNEIIPMIRQISADTGAPIIDVNTPLLNAPALFPDGVHPNDQGALQIAQLVYPTVAGVPLPTPTAVPTRSAFTQIEAESYNLQSGTQLEACSDTGGGQDVGYTDPNDYLVFKNIDFGSGASSVQLRLASAATFNGTVELRLGSPTGTLIGTVGTGNTGGWQTWVTSTAAISGASGVQNLYLVFQGGAGIANINWLKFVGGTGPTLTPTRTNTPTATPTRTPTPVVSGALSRTGWVATGSSTGAGETPGSALDGNAITRWSTGAAQANGQWFQVDMLSVKTFNQITLDAGASTGDYPRGYQVFVSNDGANWGNAVATGTGAAQLVTVNFAAQTARYIRLVQTGSTGNWWSLHEFNVYGTTAASCTGAVLSRSGWGSSASSTGAGETSGNAIDGNTATRWSTGAAQVNGQWFQVDMLSARTFCSLTLDAGASTGDYPRGYQVFVSNDGANWGSAVASGSGTTQLVTVSFAAQTARYIRIVQTGSIGNWWSLHELNVIN